MALDGAAQARLQTAAVFAFGHGVALRRLRRAAARPDRHASHWLAMLLGVLLFSGSLASAHCLGTTTLRRRPAACC